MTQAKPCPRRTLAVLLDYMNIFGRGYEAELRAALHARCQEQGIALVLVYGHAFEEPPPLGPPHNAVFELISPQRFDGLVIVSSVTAAHGGSAAVRRYVARHAELPMCSVGLRLPGIPSVVIDGGPATEAMVEHLIHEHDKRRIVFLSGTPGSQESEQRLRAYLRALKRHGLPVDERLVRSGEFGRDGARQAMEQLLSEGIAIDAIVAANDSMAAGAIDVLRARGLRVPRDMAVTGFDDLPLAHLGNPPLSTIAQPFAELAATAVGLVLDSLEGRATPQKVTLQGELVLRRSCGCGQPHRLRIGTVTRGIAPAAGEPLANYLSKRRERLAAAVRAPAAGPLRDEVRILDALTAELSGGSGSLVVTLEDIIEELGDDLEQFRHLLELVGSLRKELEEYADPRLESLWLGAINAIALGNTTCLVKHRADLDDNYLRLLGSAEQASTAFDLQSLAQALTQSLPLVGVHSAFAARFLPGEPSEASCFFALLDDQPLEVAEPRVPAVQLLPTEAFDTSEPRTWVLFPMAHEDRLLGIIAFLYSPSFQGYSVLRDQVTGALRNVELHHEVLHQNMLRERSVQERAATARRIQALSVLAGGVAHDLNNALGPLVALPDVMLEELRELDPNGGRSAEIRGDLQTIRTAALRASRTIKDLLTLGRQGKTLKEAVDLNQTIRTCLGEEARRALRLINPAVEVELELAAESLPIQAAEAQLMRAITNLLRNAVEAIEGAGRVVVRSSGQILREPQVGVEQIEPGSYVVLSVSDDGSGIAPAELCRVFEPFFTSKRASDQSGTGLGLAIVHSVVKEHDGFIDVKSTVGRGTEFLLYLPRVAEPVRQQSSIPVRPARGHERILVIDDEPVQLRASTRVLRRFGYQVDSLPSGQKALERFRSAQPNKTSPYDLLIVDMQLNEDQDGLEVIEQIVQMFPAQRAIVVSGHAPNQRAEKALAEGLVWLVKPYTAQALLSAVEQSAPSQPTENPQVELTF